MRRKVIPSIIAILLLIVGIASFFNFSETLFNNSKNDSKAVMEQVMQHQAYSMKDELRNSSRTIQMIADSFADFAAWDASTLGQRLQDYNNHMHFKLFLIAHRDGMAKDAMGKQYDVSNNPAFQGALLGSTNIYENCGVIDKNAIVISSPVVKDGRVQGIVLGEYDMFFLSQIINMENDGKESYTALMKPDGDYIIAPFSATS